jgi:hypothetical protein
MPALPGLTGLVSDYLLTLLRGTLSDLDASASGRWQDATLYNWLDRSNKRLVGEVLFPDSRILQPSVPGVGLYQFPLMLKTERVYVAGQLCLPSDVATLQGEQINLYDDSSDGSTSSGPYSDAPPGTLGPGAPLWTTQEPLSYPVGPDFTSPDWTTGSALTPWFTPKPDAEPWFQGSQPRYYWRGGWLGFVPPIANLTPGVTICLEGVRQPDTIAGPGQALVSPENFAEAIVWGAIVWAKFSDAGNLSKQLRDDADAYYIRERRRLIQWRWGYQGQQRDGPKPAVLRPRYANYKKRTTRC